MNQRKRIFLHLMVILVFLLPFAQAAPAQEGVKTIQSGQLTPQQVQECLKALEKMKDGQLSPEAIEELKERCKTGTLTPEEIEAGKRLLEQKKGVKPEEKKPQEEIQQAPEKAPEKEVEKQPEKEVEKQPEKGVEEQREKEKKEIETLEIFGHSLFLKPPSTFAPISTVPVSDDYVIGPGDEIRVLMWGRIDASYDLVVDNEGVINFPEIGPLTVAGLTFGDLKVLIKQKVEAITGVNASVSMGKLRTIQVFVLGEVKSPGLYTVSSLATIVNALLFSGGPNPLGSLRRVELKREGRVITTLDLYDLLLQGDTSKDSRLTPGDVIFIPQVGPLVTVWGDVRRPAIYELKDQRTLQAALRLAGGLGARAYAQRIQIERAFENRVQIVVDISAEELKERTPIPVQDGDVIRVFSILPSTENAVYLYGNVLRPGPYQYKPGLRVLDILPNLKVLDKDTYFDYALIKRYRLQDMSTTLLPFDLGGLLLHKDKTQNIPLMPLDEIYIFDKQMFKDKANADIQGEVRKPGTYPIDEGMRLKELIFKAGNLTRDAYLHLGHLYRKDPQTKETSLITFNVKKAMAGDPEDNVVLRDEDTVFIHSVWDYKEKYTVSITGMVHNPGEYPFASNMTVKDLILVGGNIKAGAYMDEAELVRSTIVNGEEVKTSIRKFNVRLALQGDPANNVTLRPLDVVHIKEIPDWWEKKKTVAVKGEVRFPGTYQIRKDERLSDVIERAGGFTEYAYLMGAFFTRESVKKLHDERLAEMTKNLEVEIAAFGSESAQAAQSREDVALQTQYLAAQKALIAKLREAKASGRVVISLMPLQELKGSSSDLILEDGDTLSIPQKAHTVNVLGSVYNPSALIFEENRRELKYYLAKTGGPTDNAETDQMYIIRADGTVLSKEQAGGSWLGFSWRSEDNRWTSGGSFETTALYPGDTVLVPQKLIRPNYMRSFKDITQVLYQIAVIAGITISQVF
jgi:polysaccharide export outer membrane protein